MSILVAIASMFSWGASDYAGGVAARRTSAMVVGAISFAAELLTGLIAFSIVGGTFHARDMLFGLTAGLAGAFALPYFYFSISRGRVGVVAPITGVMCAVGPAVVGLLIGDSLIGLQWLGIAIAFPAVWLVSSSVAEHATATTTVATDVRRALLCGSGFCAYLILIGMIGDDAGALPTVWVGVATNSVVLVMFLTRKLVFKVARESIAPAIIAGVLNASGTLMFVLSVRLGSLSVTGVITALYPAVTIALARFIDKEALSSRQLAGISLACATVVLIALA